MTENRSLAVVSLQDAALVPLSTPAVKDYMVRLLHGSNLLPDDLLFDLAAQMTAKPALKDCTPQSLYGTLVYAAKMHLTFGVGGVWPVPFGDQDEEGQSKGGPKVCTPVLDYRAMEKIAKERHGILLPLHMEFVYEGEHYREVRSGGKIVEIEHEIDRAADRENPKFIIAYAVAEHVDGRRTILPFSFSQVDKRKKASPSMRSKSTKKAWASWEMEMYRKTVIRMAMNLLIPDFAAGMGSAGGEFEGEVENQEPKNITGEVNAANAVARNQTQTDKLKSDLGGVTPDQQAIAHIGTQTTLAALETEWSNKDGLLKKMWAAADQGQRKAIKAALDKKKADLQSAEVKKDPPAAETDGAPKRPGLNVNAEDLEKTLIAHHKDGKHGMDWWEKNEQAVKALPEPMAKYIQKLHVHLYPEQ